MQLQSISRELQWTRKWKSLSHARLIVDSPGQNTGVGSLFLLQGIFPTQGSNPGLPHCRWFLYQLSYKGSPRILEWVACPFSSGSSLKGALQNGSPVNTKTRQKNLHRIAGQTLKLAHSQSFPFPWKRELNLGSVTYFLPLPLWFRNAFLQTYVFFLFPPESQSSISCNLGLLFSEEPCAVCLAQCRYQMAASYVGPSPNSHLCGQVRALKFTDNTVCCVLSHVGLFVTPWTVARQVPLSIGFSRQEYWSGLPFLTPGALANPGIEPSSLVSAALQVDSLPLSHLRSPADYRLTNRLLQQQQPMYLSPQLDIIKSPAK